MFSLYDYPIPGQDDLPLCSTHGQQLELKEVVIYDKIATEAGAPDPTAGIAKTSSSLMSKNSFRGVKIVGLPHSSPIRISSVFVTSHFRSVEFGCYLIEVLSRPPLKAQLSRNLKNLLSITRT